MSLILIFSIVVTNYSSVKSMSSLKSPRPWRWTIPAWSFTSLPRSSLSFISLKLCWILMANIIRALNSVSQLISVIHSATRSLKAFSDCRAHTIQLIITCFWLEYWKGSKSGGLHGMSCIGGKRRISLHLVTSFTTMVRSGLFGCVSLKMYWISVVVGIHAIWERHFWSKFRECDDSSADS